MISYVREAVIDARPQRFMFGISVACIYTVEQVNIKTMKCFRPNKKSQKV